MRIEYFVRIKYYRYNNGDGANRFYVKEEKIDTGHDIVIKNGNRLLNDTIQKLRQLSISKNR